MAANEIDGSGNGNRATVALVDAKADMILEVMKGGFRDTQRQLNLVTGLPAVVATLKADAEGLKARVQDLENAASSRSGALPGLVVSLGMLALAALNIYVIVKYGHAAK